MRRLGRYEIVDVLGQGGASIVYLARDSATERPVAVKVLTPRLPHQGEALARFQREIKLTVQLEHPHIVPIFDVGVDDDQPYIVLRLLSGGSLADRIQHGPLALQAALAILKQVASALDAAHQRKIIHRDVKPSNILFDLNGTAYLTDFGIAKAIDAATTPDTAWAVGTPAFISPEQLRGEAIGAWTDEYALGIVAFVMLTGRLPYAGTTAHIITQQLTQPLPDIQKFNPQLPATIQAVLARATQKDPAQRYASVGEFVAALDEAAQAWLALGRPTPVLGTGELAPPVIPALDLASGPPPPRAAGEATEKVLVVAPTRRRWLRGLVLPGLALGVVLLAGWRLGAFAGLAPATATLASAMGTQSANIQATEPPLMVTLAADAIGVAVVTLPPGTSGAALRATATGDTLLSLPDRTIVQVMAGRQQLADESIWVRVRAPGGQAGWVAEALLTYLSQPGTTLTPGSAPPATALPDLTPSATGGQPTAGVTPGTAPAVPTGSATGMPAATAQPTIASGPTGPPAATAKPGSTSTSAAGAPSRTPVPPTAPATGTRPAPSNTVPAATNTMAPTNTAAPSDTPAPTHTKTPVPTNTPIIQLPTLPIPTLPLP